MTLYEFLGEGMTAIGTTDLVVTLGDESLVVANMLELVVIDCPTTYNTILGRPVLMAFEAITFVRHLAINPPSSSGICTDILLTPKASGHLLKWAFKLIQFEILYKPQTIIKGQALTDFVAECIGFQDESLMEPVQELWKLFIDRSSNDHGSGTGIFLITLEGHRSHTTLRISFHASNNEAEYEALLAGVQIVMKLKEKVIQYFSDSQHVVNKVLGEYQA
ncbi:uncharacterized protein LOC133792425 [Humulus lupulus]|uniref:uncharacterized protein LOC133792425 n=1 Tax=Humulus lupulus TaxID=3486 RepID=UPI002B40A92F|nr:uncharacterized protein LOC133792425 [Humulus lupulus]